MSRNNLIVETLVVGQMAANCYIVRDGSVAVVIDPGDDGQYIIDTLQKYSLTLKAIVATHGHFDHIMAAYELQISLGLPFLMGKGDEFLLKNMRASANHYLHITTDPPPTVTKTLADGDIITVGAQKLSVIAVPGHTPGSIALVSNEWIIVGDVLFSGGAVGRTDFSYSDKEQLMISIQKIRSYPEDYILYPGHGEKTTIGDISQLFV
ncbi:MBL fold metallo-hydrolase [Candidatus Gottesmanbacteria bacterium]|nr:MBL fold metallo-hydrolase [Candidatus Gottesmanbacteria bacterium]